MKKKYQLIIIIYTISFVFGYSLERKVGDVLQIALPITAISSTYYMNDTEGFKSFLKSYIFTISTTHLLKQTTHKLRPDGSNYLSFPSGHTSSAFAGAMFIQNRYGYKFGIPSLLLASFVGFSRVDAKKHYWEDVVAGATISIVSAYLFVNQKNEQRLELSYSPYLKQINLYISL